MGDDKATEQNDGTLLRFFKALSNATRLKLVGHLATAERSVGELAELLDLKEPIVSRHLRTLEALDLVTTRADETTQIYALNTAALETMNKNVFAHAGAAAQGQKEIATTWEDKVLQSFVVDGQITADPAKQKKRVVILRWLAEKFTPGQAYTEKEVNAIIQEHNPDCATWRRYLVDEGLMTRSEGVYRRVA